MSLATRCTACGTVFRVVQDQLRVSGGWVRCGRCGEVFNAVESLVDLELDRPGDGGPPSVHGARVMEELARVAGAADAPPAPATPPSSLVVPGAPGGPGGPGAAMPAQAGLAPPQAELAALPSGPTPPRTEATPPQPDGRAEPGDAPTAAPGFVRQAERAARWRRPWVRATLAGLALAAAGGLVWQVQLTHHDWIAARWPALSPWVQRLCDAAGCIVEPPRRIESLAVESSGLVRAGAAGAYRLTVVLRNRDRLALRVPALDLTLTDALGRVVARRVLTPGELGASVTSVPGGAELALAATLRMRDAPVVGYTIEIFYP